MEYQQNRLEYLESSPLQLPAPKKDEKGAVAKEDFYLLPPKGIARTADEKPEGPLSRYRSSDKNAVIKEMLVGVRTEKASGFRTEVLEALGASGAARPKEVERPIGPALHFDSYRLQAGTTYLYFYRQGTYQLAIAYRTSGASAAIETQIDYSLASLKLGQSARDANFRGQKSEVKNQ